MGQASIKKSGSNIHLELVATTYDSFVTATLQIGTEQEALTVNTSPTVPTSQPCFEVLVQADPDNTAAVFVGSLGGCYFQLDAGASLTVPINDVGKVYVRAASGVQRVNWLAMI